MPSAPETQFLLINLSFNPSVSCFTPSLSRSLPLSQNSPMLNCFFFLSLSTVQARFYAAPFFFHLALRCSGSPGTQTITEKETLVLSLCEEEKQKRWNGKKTMEEQGRGSGGRCPNVCLCLIGPRMSRRPSQITVRPGGKDETRAKKGEGEKRSGWWGFKEEQIEEVKKEEAGL